MTVALERLQESGFVHWSTCAPHWLHAHNTWSKHSQWLRHALNKISQLWEICKILLIRAWNIHSKIREWTKTFWSWEQSKISLFREWSKKYTDVYHNEIRHEVRYHRCETEIRYHRSEYEIRYYRWTNKILHYRSENEVWDHRSANGIRYYKWNNWVRYHRLQNTARK